MLTGSKSKLVQNLGHKVQIFPFQDLAIANYKWPFTTIYAIVLETMSSSLKKTEVQTIILRCLTSLKLNWSKIYDTIFGRGRLQIDNDSFVSSLVISLDVTN